MSTLYKNINGLLAIILSSTVLLIMSFSLEGTLLSNQPVGHWPKPGKTNIAPAGRQDWALLFANNDYKDSKFANLEGPVGDAEKLGTVLESQYNFKVEIHRNADLHQIRKVLREWQQKAYGEKDQLFVFFSGHGHFDEELEKGYYVPSGEIGDYNCSTIALDDIAVLVKNIPCAHILLAIDACYSGTIDSEIRFKSEDAKLPRNKIDSINQRLAFLKAQWEFTSRLLITSGGKVRTPDNSKFATCLYNGLVGACNGGDGLYSYLDILSHLQHLSSPKPHHGIFYGHNNGGFVFVAKNNLKAIDAAEMANQEWARVGYDFGVSDSCFPAPLDCIVPLKDYQSLKIITRDLIPIESKFYWLVFQAEESGKVWPISRVRISSEQEIIFKDDLPKDTGNGVLLLLALDNGESELLRLWQVNNPTNLPMNNAPKWQKSDIVYQSSLIK